MKKIELNETDLNRLNVLFQLAQQVTDPTLIRTKSAVFVDLKIIKDLEQLFYCMGREGLWKKLLN